MHTEVTVPNPNYELVPGMYASVKIPLHTVTNVLTVPVQAVQSTGTGQGTVLVVNSSNHLERREVKLGLQSAYGRGSALRPERKRNGGIRRAESVQRRPARLAANRQPPREWSKPTCRHLQSRHPYFIIVVCLFICVLGVTSLAQMPVDMFPPINIPVVLVATFYNGMPPEQIEADITDTFERFFTLGSGIDHMESRSHGRRQPDQNLFSAGYRRQCRRHQHFQSRHGRFAPPAGRHAAAGGD